MTRNVNASAVGLIIGSAATSLEDLVKGSGNLPVTAGRNLSQVARSLFGDFGQERVATRNRPGWRTQSLFRINRRYVRVYRKNNDGAKSKKKGDS
jgi:hypothetical protein